MGTFSWVNCNILRRANLDQRASGTAGNPFFLISEAVDLCTASKDAICLLEGTYWQHFMVADKANLYIGSADPLKKATL